LPPKSTTTEGGHTHARSWTDEGLQVSDREGTAATDVRQWLMKAMGVDQLREPGTAVAASVKRAKDDKPSQPSPLHRVAQAHNVRKERANGRVSLCTLARVAQVADNQSSGRSA
jgi:hypothetical protein